MSRLKSYPVGHGNHNNVHYILRGEFFIFKLCAFPDVNKVYIMSSSIKIDKRLIDKNYLYLAMREELKKWDLELIANSDNLFNLRFENTEELLKSEYFLN